jgi:putative membrane-bound dehydrogenase-like protein
LSPGEALEAFKIAPGFEIELVASEPLVDTPVAMAWDEYSRLYVVEMRSYMPNVDGDGKDDPVGQITRLTDTDNDGKMDKSEVFLGKLVNPRAVAIINEGILVGEPPNLWLCRLETPEQVCTEKERIGDYGADVGKANVEHMENGLLQGLDNWLYNAKSARSFKYRNGEWIVRHGPKRGQWGLDQDNWGRLFYNHNSTWLQADLFYGEDFINGETDTKYQGIEENLTEVSEVFSVRVNPGVNRAYIEGTLRADGRLNKATGVSGLGVYRGDQFPEAYLRDVFIPEIAGNVVSQFRISEQGIQLSAEQQLYADETWGQRDFLGSTDERFRPVDAFNGPDGALYILDMYRGIVQDSYYMSDELRAQILQRNLDKPLGKGRIWRVTHSEGKALAGFPNLGAMSSAELVDALQSTNGWTRDTAQRLLIAREDDVTQALESMVAGDDSLAAIHALWTLEGRGDLTSAAVARALESGDEWRQYHAIRAGSDALDASALLGILNGSQNLAPRVVMQIAAALTPAASDSKVRGALQAALHDYIEDVFVRQAVVHAVAGSELQFLVELTVDPILQSQSAANEALLAALTAQAYRNLRGDLTSEEAAPQGVLDLIEAIESTNQEWQKIAMLNGLESLARIPGFVPAMLAGAPDLFEREIDSQPLAEARIAAHRAFTWPGDLVAAGVTPLTPEQERLMAKGAEFYLRCAGCHGTDGAGLVGLAPPLAGAEWVTGPSEWLGRIILQGMSGPITVKGKDWNGIMPAHGHIDALDDETFAGLLTYLRRSWGNTANAVSVDQVAAIRAATVDRKKPWTASELEQVPFDRGFGPYIGQYKVSFITIEITEEPEGLMMSAGVAGSGLLVANGTNSFKVEGGDKPMTVEFVRSGDGPAESLVINRDGQSIPAKRKD